MLPSPASSSLKRRAFHRIVSPRRRIVDILFSRTRLTNLAVFLLIIICFLSLCGNLRFYLSALTPRLHSNDISTSNHGVFLTITRTDFLQNLTHLVIVPCHAIWIGADAALRSNEDNWILEPYQKGGSRVAAFFEHIQRGAEITLQDKNSLLIFSGGQTRLRSTTTEAESYLRLALNANIFRTQSPQTPFERATTEDHALDSYQNLLFSIARFREFTGFFPKKITVVGYEFKRARFTDLHRAALRWPLHSFHYVGVDPDEEHSRNAEEGEKKNGYLPYSVDKYGCHSFLLAKRRARNPFSRFHSYYTSSSELAPLIDWCPNEDGGDNALFSGPLPWDQPSWW